MSCHTDIHTHTQKEDAHVSRKCVDSARYCLGADCFCGFWLPFSGLLVIWNLAISSAREHLCTEAEAVVIGRPAFGISLLPREREPREQAEIWNCWNSILGPCKSDKLLSNRKGLDEESRSPGSPSFHHIPTARGEHQAGRLPLAMSSPQEFTGTAVTASALVSIVSSVVVILVSLLRYVNLFWSVSLVWTTETWWFAADQFYSLRQGAQDLEACEREGFKLQSLDVNKVYSTCNSWRAQVHIGIQRYQKPKKFRIGLWTQALAASVEADTCLCLPGNRGKLQSLGCSW